MISILCKAVVFMQMPKLYKAAAVTSFYCNCTSMLIVKDANDFSNLVEFGAFA